MAVLAIASYCFYFYWDYHQGLRGGFTLLMIGSTSINYLAGKRMARLAPESVRHRKLLLVLPIVVNLSLLAAFKYATFAWNIASDIRAMFTGQPFDPLHIILPIGISFFTFEAISYIVDVYRGTTKPAPHFLEYCCFISMFPRQIAGPIVRYSDLEAQFVEKRATRWAGPDWQAVNIGLLLFTMGMVKKVLVADRIAEVINPIWRGIGVQGEYEHVAYFGAVLGYTFQIYFDFSGYSDMAVGLAHLFGLRLPQNFNSPYKAIDAIDFWRRWHMTLSAWLRDYLYIPLGGNRTGHRTRNLMFTMLLGGLWHGAAWQFILWGGWHGLLLIVYHQLRERRWLSDSMSRIAHFANRQVLFLLVVLGWVLFRATDLSEARFVLARLIGLGPGEHPAGNPASIWFYCGLGACWLWCNLVPNSFEIAYKLPQRARYALLAGAALAVCVFFFGSKTDFIYFRF